MRRERTTHWEGLARRAAPWDGSDAEGGFGGLSGGGGVVVVTKGGERELPPRHLSVDGVFSPPPHPASSDSCGLKMMK